MNKLNSQSNFKPIILSAEKMHDAIVNLRKAVDDGLYWEVIDRGWNQSVFATSDVTFSPWYCTINEY